MNKKVWIAAKMTAAAVCVLSGCGRSEKQQEELLLISAYAETEEEAGKVFDGTGAVQTQSAPAGTNGVPESSGGENENTAEDSDGNDIGNDGQIVVHICGAVNSPGVYILEENSRIYQAVEEAGGFTPEADADYLNQAEILSDGMKLYVPTRQETAELVQEQGFQVMSGSANPKNGADTRVNINTADEADLCTLPGVGSARAKSIITYREKNGAFQKIEDIMNVEGIKEGLFQKIRDSITVQ